MIQQSLKTINEYQKEKALDIVQLRQKGLQYIQELSGKIWTDHNLHNPGITALELLNYAISDLGYRTRLNIRDIILSSTNGEIKVNRIRPDFFPAAEVLPTYPITPSDYRKLLISEIPQVRNAWLVKIKHKEEDPNSINTSPFNGLYKVLVEFEGLIVNEEDLSKGIVSREIQEGGQVHQLEVEFPGQVVGMKTIPKEDNINQIRVVELKEEGSTAEREKQYSTTLSLKYSSGKKEEIKVRVRTGAEVGEETIRKQLQKHGKEGLVPYYPKRVVTAQSVLEEVRQTLNANRNLCEDFEIIKEVKKQDIVTNGTLEVSPNTSDADLIELLAEIYFQIDQFLDPPIPTYTLDEMLQSGKDVEEIFDGPWFGKYVDIEALEKIDERDALYTSEFVRLILGVNQKWEGKRKLLRVSDLTLSSFLDDEIRILHAPICLKLYKEQDQDLYIPRAHFYRGKGHFTVFRNGQLIQYEAADVWQKYQQLIAKAHQTEHNVENASTDLPIPKGKAVDIETYHSIQNLFPLVYGIGEEGLPASASETRLIQAMQFKAYLLLFEQFLANYLAQLNNVKNLLSVNFPVDRTYFSQPLENVPNIQSLLTKAYNNFISQKEEEDPDISKEIWTKEDYRKNQFLDHLLARFGEAFVDYGTFQLSSNQPHPVHSYLIRKRSFLQDIPKITKERSRAFNYLIPPSGIRENYIPGRNNISDLENKLSHLFNLEAWKNYFEIYHERDDDEILEYRFRLRDNNGKIILSSSTRYFDLKSAYDEIHQVVFNGTKIKNYRIFKASNGKFYFNLVDNSGEVIARRIEPFDNNEKVSKNEDQEENINAEIARVSEFLISLKNNQQFYLIEHILLRHSEEYGNCAETGNEDFYSFRCTALFIYKKRDNPNNATVRFELPEFRNQVEKTLRREMPAHIFPDNILWIEDTGSNLNHFNNWHLKWRNGLAKPNSEYAELAKASCYVKGQLRVLSRNKKKP